MSKLQQNLEIPNDVSQVSKNQSDCLHKIREILDTKVDILTTALIKEMSSPEFQNEYTYARRVQTLRVFADLIESIYIA